MRPPSRLVMAGESDVYDGLAVQRRDRDREGEYARGDVAPIRLGESANPLQFECDGFDDRRDGGGWAASARFLKAVTTASAIESAEEAWGVFQSCGRGGRADD